MARKKTQPPKNTTSDKDILNAIGMLDPENADHWNEDGTASMTAIEGFIGDKSVTRKDVERLAPRLHRDTPLDEAYQSGVADPGSPGNKPHNPHEGRECVLFCTQNVVGPDTEVRMVPVAYATGFGDPAEAVEVYNTSDGESLPEKEGFGYRLCPVDEWDGDEVPDVHLEK